jgi:uncharacterized repeat protein (TIGR02543 family)
MVGSDTVLTFSNTGTCDWNVPSDITSLRVLVVGGGGSSGGGYQNVFWAPGGGGGAVVPQTLSVTSGSAISVTVGAGGAAPNYNAELTSANNGTSSSIVVSQSVNATASGGFAPSRSSGNGGRSGNNNAGGSGAGGTWGNGGGGAGAAGSGANGGAGVSSDITGASIEYGGGGGGYNGGTSIGSATGGGATFNVAALANRGGGGAQGATGSNGLAGGSGVVIIRYSPPIAPTTITYDANGGNTSAPTAQTQSSSGQALTLANYTGTKNSKRFMNWNTAADGSGTHYKVGASLTPTANLTLYAVWMDAYCPEGWTWSEPTCTKNYTGTQNFIIPWGFRSLDVIAVGGSGGNGSRGSGGVPGKVQASYSFTQGDDIKFFPGGAASGRVGGVDTYPNTNYNGGTGFTNNGGSGGGGAATVVTKNGSATTDVIVVAGGGGGGGATWSCYSGNYFSLGGGPSTNGESGVSSNGTTIGSNGVNHGWNRFSGAGGGGTNGGNAGGATQAWNDNCGSSNGGTGLGGYRGGNTITSAAATVFNGANSVNGVSGSVTLQLTRPVVNYNLNGAAGSAPAKQIQSSEGEDLTIAAVGVTRSGFTFGGWYTAANGTGTLYTPGDTYNTNAVVTLYAKWSSTVTFSGNSNTGGSAPSTVTLLGLASTTLPTNSGSLTRTNFTFDGWNTLANGSGTHYAVGSTYTTAGDVTLYARWNSTITYNGNGSNTGVVPSSTTARGTAANTTLAGAGTMGRTNFTLVGWNTTADGSGTSYAPGLTTYQASGNITLYAIWRVAITYNSNGATGSPSRSSDTIDSPFTPLTLANLPTIGTMSRPGYTFGGWNTLANGTGTNYSSTMPREYMRFKATNFNDATNAWSDSSGNNRNIPGTAVTSTAGNVHGNPTQVDATGNGASANFKAVKGGTTDGIVLGNEALTNFTMCHVARYAGSTRGRIFAGVTGNWLSGYWSQGAGIAYHEGWITNYPGTNDTNWRVICDSGGSSSRLRSNGVDRTTVTNNSNGMPANLSINLNSSRTAPTDTSEWEVAEIVIYSQILNTYQIEAIEASLSTEYGITAYTTPATPATAGSYTPTGNATLYARWFPNGYTVTFDTSTATSGSLPAQWFTAGTAFNLSANSLVKTGYSFRNWNTAANGSGSTYTNSQSVTLYSDLTMYPQWSLLAPGAPTVTVVEGNTEVTVTPTPIASSGSVGPPTSMLVTTYNSSGVALNPAKTCTVVLPATSCVISGLTNGTRYQFAATATNATSTSASSTKVNGTPAGAVITFNATANGGSTATTSATYNKPTAVTLPAATKSGFTFSGWYTTQASGGQLIGGAAATYSPTAAITLYARFVGVVYTITYNGNGNTGGEVPSMGSYENGSSAYVILGATNPPSKIGYTFSDWYSTSTGSGGTSYSVGANYSTASNLTLFAKWTPATRTVTYALNSGTSSANTTTLTGMVIGNTVTLPAANTMSRTGYVFAGWNDGTTTFAGGATWTVPASDNDFTLTAQWTTQTLSYSYDTNGGGTAPASGTKTYGQSLVLEASTGLSKTGYTFAGWNDGSETHRAGATITLNASKVFVAQWSAQSFSITYDGNGSTSGSITVGSYVAGGVPYAIAENGFTKAGYSFAGWKDASNNSFSVGAGYSTAANLVLTAQWTASTYTVSYNGNGSTSGSAPSNATLTTGVTFNASTNSGNLTKTGYTFNGWNTNAAGTGTNIAENGVLTATSNIVLYAKWAIISPAITFDKGVATTTPTIFPANTSSQYGTLFTLPTTDTSTVISSVTQIFTGWSDGTNTYAAGDTYRVGIDNITFTAQWIAVYTVRYVLNGGTGTVPADILRTDQFTETLTSASVTKTGFTLTGWKDQSGASITAGANNWLITGTSYVAYAQWSPTQRTLSFNVNGGSDSQASITGKVIGELVTLPTPTSTKTGYTFTGWSNSGTTYPAGGTFVVGNGDAAFVATWTGNVNTITYNGNGASGGTAPVSGSYVSGDSTPYTVSANTGTLVKSGFTFDNWYTTSTGSGGTAYIAGSGTLTTTSNLTLYAKWSAASYAVTYNTDGGSNAPTQADTMYGATFTLPSAPTKSGNNFLGWESSSNLYAPGSLYTMGSSALNFVARWSAVTYAITYALNGGAGVAPTQDNVAYNQGFTTAAAPSRSGYTFAGWSDGATTTNAETSISNVTANKTLTAQWSIAPPGTPGAPTAIPGNGNATVTITAPSSGGTPSSYTVTASPGGATCTVVAPGTSCTISPLTNGTAYTFTSTATNSAGSSTTGSNASAAITPAGIPSTPLGVSGSGTGGSINLSWTTPDSDGGSAITDYVVEYRVTSSGTWSTFSDAVSTATSATVTGLTAGNSYEFRVAAKNIIGTSLASFESASISTLPNAPTIATVVAASGQVTVTWSAPAHLGSGSLTGDEYEVTAYDTNGNVAGTCIPTSGQRSCVVTGLTNGSSYTFKVKAITNIGESALSISSTVVKPAGVTNAPTNVVAVTNGSNMTVTFSAPSDNGGSEITSYVVTSTPAGATCTAGANATSYTCTGLTAGTNYTYSVKAVNSMGQSSDSLSSTAVTAVAPPSAPLNVVAVITAGTTTLSATVSFDPPANENGSPVTSYTVTASPGGATCTINPPTTYCELVSLPDRPYSFSVTATSAAGTSAASVSTQLLTATNGVAPTLIVDPIVAPTGSPIQNGALASNVDSSTFNSRPNSLITYQWKRCTNQLDETTCVTISGATGSTYTLTSTDVDKFIRIETTATNSIGSVTKLSTATAVVAAATVTTPTTTPSTPSTPSAPEPEPSPPSCDISCQAIRDAAATKAAADKLAADAAAKVKADAAATAASNKASAAVAAAVAAAKAAVERAAEAEAARIAAQTAATTAAARAKAAADAQAAANKAAATAATTLKSSAASAAAKAAATASAAKAAADAAAAVKAAATAAQQAATAKNSASNANKQVDIAINTLNSKTAASQASAQANAIAAAAKAAANEAAAAAAVKASEAKATATAAQKAAADTAARIATEQKEATTAAAAAKAAADAAAKATAEKIAATNAAKTASENLLKVLEEKATLAEQAAKTSDETVRAEISKKLEEIEIKAEEAEKIAEEATAEADDAVAEYEEAIDQATEASEVAETQAAEAVAVKAESVTKTAVATKAAAAATVAAKVATAAKAAAAKVPSKAVITKKPSTTSKNGATATVTGLKPGQKVKVTVNVKPKP